MPFFYCILLLIVSSNSSPCKTAWKFFKPTNSCYFTGHWETADAAEDTCKRNDGHIASVHSAEENVWIRGLYGTNTSNPDYTWLGLRKNKLSWTWLDRTPFDFSNWDTAPGNKPCVVQDAETLRWLTVRCDLKIHKYVCKKPAM